MSISQTLTNPPSPAPNRNTDTPSEFSDNVDAHLSWERTIISEMSAWTTQVNTTATNVNSNAFSATSSAATALAASNFKGNWSDQTGAASVPYSVYHDNKYWQLLSDLADVTTKEPGVDPEWARISFNDGVDISDDTANVTLPATMNNIQYRSQNANGRFYTLPAGISFSEGSNVAIFYNTGNYRYGIKDTDGNFICSVDVGDFASLDLIDNTTSAEVWEVKDKAELLMNWLKTAVSTDSSSYIASCKLTSTEVFVAYQGADLDGFCCVLTWVPGTPAITVSNILEFDTTDASHISCTRISDTVAAISYAGMDSDGYIAAVTYNGTDTLTVTDTHEFRDANTITHTECVTIHSSKVGIFYTDASLDLKGQVLTWNGSTFSSDTGETNILTGSVYNTQTAVLESTASTASIIVSYVDTSEANIIHVDWASSTLTPSNETVMASRGYAHSPVIPLTSAYFIVCHRLDNSGSGYFSSYVTLCHWSGSTFTIKRRIKLYGGATTLATQSNDTAFLIDSEHIGFMVRLESDNYDAKIFKIKAIGASSEGDCVLKLVSQIDVAGYGANYFNLIGLDANNAFRIYDDDTNSGYLTAEKIDIG